MGPLRAYVLAKLLWNPQTDVGKHKAEFLNAYFGKAASQIREYLDLLESRVRDGKTHAHIFDSSKAGYLSPEFLDKADEVLKTAENNAEDGDKRFHVQVARLPVWYLQLATGRVTGQARADLLEKFLAIARKAGISNISEGQALDAWAKAMGSK